MGNCFSTPPAKYPWHWDQSSQFLPPSSEAGTSRSRQPQYMGAQIYLNVRKGSISISIDESDRFSVSFIYDNILHRGSFTILFFAREESNVVFRSVLPEPQATSKSPSEMGLEQVFRQLPGTGFPLRNIHERDLTYVKDGVVPLVVGAEANGITLYILAVLQTEGNGSTYNVVETKRIIRGEDGSRGESSILFEDDGPETVCSICLDNPPDATFSCGHMMCHECGCRIQSSCPKCGQPLEGFVWFTRDVQE